METILELVSAISWQICRRLSSLLDRACNMVRSQSQSEAESHILISRGHAPLRTTKQENAICMVSPRSSFIFNRKWVVLKLQVEIVAAHGFRREVEKVASIGGQCREEYLGHDDARG
jgi:hypothetical protein